MNYTKEEVMSMVADALGDNPEGVFVDYEYIEEGGDEAAVRTEVSNGRAFWVHHTNRFSVSAGASKICLIPKNTHKDWVIKIHYTGVWATFDDGETDYIFGQFDDDYIADEVDIYEGVNDITRKVLAKNEYVGLYHGIPIYVQERAKNSFSCSEHSYNYNPKMIKSICHRLVDKASYNLDSSFVFDMILKYGIKAVNTIIKDINYYMSDLHDENYGYRADGSCIIYDYAGFHRAYAYHLCTNERPYAI